MCTSLLYIDANQRSYVGRTLELSIELPYSVARFPKDSKYESQVEGFPALQWTTRYTVLAVTMPNTVPRPGGAPQQADLKVIEGMNEAGLCFSVQSYGPAGGPQPDLNRGQAALSAIDLGTYLLGQCGTVAEAKAALENLQVVIEPLEILGGLHTPFHYAVHDALGQSLVIEFHRGVRTVYDNPVGVLTNAPQFSWHLTNLNNYTFLSNVDHSHAQFMQYQAEQPGAGIAKAGLPVSDTSPDRFIRAVYYAHFAEKQTDADQAVQMVAHIMNNFDRPRGIAIDPPEAGSAHLQVAGTASDRVPTEFTSWTSISDIERRRLYLRGSGGMNYVFLDLEAQLKSGSFVARPMASLLTTPPNVTAQFY
ncbi:MAG TPA: linear amide C-N hydrolase [Paenalcaligenes sp.]|nr:linear amide C-N hydrolase [Paenalcaligenes sp.]